MGNKPAPYTALEDQKHSEAVDLGLEIRTRNAEPFEHRRMDKRQQKPYRNRTCQKDDRPFPFLADNLQKEYRTKKQRLDYPSVNNIESYPPRICVVVHLKHGHINFRNINKAMQIIGQRDQRYSHGKNDNDLLDIIAYLIVTILQMDRSNEQKRRHHDQRNEIEIAQISVCDNGVYEQTVPDHSLKDIENHEKRRRNYVPSGLGRQDALYDMLHPENDESDIDHEVQAEHQCRNKRRLNFGQHITYTCQQQKADKCACDLMLPDKCHVPAIPSLHSFDQL